MIGHKSRLFKVHSAIALEELVPQDNFYRQVESKLDLSFVRDLVREHYATSMGRPSIDPVVFFKLQLIMFFEGIRSERQLMEQVNLNLAFRWYIGYDLDETVPDHSSLSKIRDRYGLLIFQRFFEHVVECCIEAGLVWGKELYFDGTKVEANADKNGLVPRFYGEAKQHLQTLFENSQSPQEETTTAHQPGYFVQKYDGMRISGIRTPWYQRKTDIWVSLTDPDASPMKRSNEGRSKLGYHTHYVVDGGRARIILAALVTPASIMDNVPMLDLARWVRFRWKLWPRMAVGDAKYGTIPNIVGLEQDGIHAYVALPNQSRSKKYYSIDRFQYVAARDVFICPQGQEIPLHHRSKKNQHFAYRANPAICNACSVKSKCTKSKSGRSLVRSFFYDYLERVKGYHMTETYKKVMRKRQVWVEPLFGEAKQWHGLRQFRLRRLNKVNIEAVMTAAGQNIKRLLKHKGWTNRPDPVGGAMAMALLPSFLFSRFRDPLPQMQVISQRA